MSFASKRMEEEHHQDQPIYRAPRNLNINTHKSREETMKLHQRDLSSYYGLRENPKKKTHNSFDSESPGEEESKKKILFRCDECGKGFRYEKCLSNHRACLHFSTTRVYEESMEALWVSFSLVKRKKRSRVIRYKKNMTTPLYSSVSTLASNVELEVAECLILLSLSSPKFFDGLKHVSQTMDANLDSPRGSYDDSGCSSNKKPRKACDFESRVLCSYGRSKEQACFLGDTNMFDQQKWREAGEFESEFSSDKYKGRSSFLGHKHGRASYLGEKDELDQLKLRESIDFERMFLSAEVGVGETMEFCDSGTEMVEYDMKKRRYEQHQCRLCNKMFSSYQALGGHQTFHRISKSNKTKKKYCREESVDESKKRHECSICSRLFMSVHALGGHKKSHFTKRLILKNRA